MVLLLEPEAQHSPEAALCQRLPQPLLLQEVQVAFCRTLGVSRPGPPYNHATSGRQQRATVLSALAVARPDSLYKPGSLHNRATLGQRQQATI